jgi:hypothetical protein
VRGQIARLAAVAGQSGEEIRQVFQECLPEFKPYAPEAGAVEAMERENTAGGNIVASHEASPSDHRVERA